MPAHYVKAYVKRGKNDAADAEAICEAVQRPTMRFVGLKSAEQQSVLMLHRTRELLVRQRTMLVNAIRAHMAEFGIVTRVGLPQIKELLAVIADRDDHRLPPDARACLESLGRQFLSLHEEICAADKRLQAWHRSNELSAALGDHTRHRTDHGKRVGGLHHRSFGVQDGPRDGGLDRTCAAAELDRREAAARQNLQTGRSVSAVAARRRRHGRDPARQTARHSKSALAR